MEFARTATRQLRKRSNHVGVAREEKRLVSTLIAAIRRKVTPRKSLIVATELDCFQGIADVVVGTYNGYRLFPKEAKAKLSLISFSTARVLSSLAGRKVSSIEKIAHTTGLSVSTIRKELTLLQKLGIIRPGRGSRVSIVHTIWQPFKEIVAFEVKVKDWKSGIYQARNYKSFAHKVSVALPLKRANLLKKRLPEFRRMRVGLLGIGPTGDVKWLLRPRRQKPISGPQNFLAALNLLRTPQQGGLNSHLT